jgi:phage shock protein C
MKVLVITKAFPNLVPVLTKTMTRFIYSISDIFERQAFGVCAWLGDKLRMKSSQIRLFFIYASFLTLGSPLIVYLHMAFILKIKDYIKSSRTRVWDL